MIDRRPMLAGLAAAGATTAALPARAQSWKAQYPELVFAVVPAENASGVTDRYQPFVEYLSKQLGTKVTLRVKVTGLKCNGCLKLLNGSVEISFFAKDRTQIVVCRCKLRFDLYAYFKLLARIF